MRKFISRQEREKRTKRKQMGIGIFLVSIMLLSTLGYSIQSAIRSGNEETLVYNGIEFVHTNGFWTIGNFAFKYSPEEVPETSASLNDASFYEGLPLYLYSESNDAEAEIRVNLRQIASSISDACPAEDEVPGAEYDEEAPIIPCDEDSLDNFIIIRESPDTKISQENNCVYIEGPEQELAMLADQFLYRILGVK